MASRQLHACQVVQVFDVNYDDQRVESNWKTHVKVDYVYN